MPSRFNATVSFAVLLAIIACEPSPRSGTGSPRDSLVTISHPACAECRLDVAHSIVIGRGSEQFGGPTRGNLARDSRGQFYHVSAYTPQHILVFDSIGRFVRTIGQQGRGPGEFESVWRVVVGRGDTLHVFDQRTGVYSVLTPHGEFVRSTILPAPVAEAAELRPGVMVVNLRRAAVTGMRPVHVLVDGDVAAALEDSVVIPDPRDRPNAYLRYLARQSDTTFWAAAGDAYRVELRHDDGRLIRRLVGEPDWFAQADRSTLEGRINPGIRGLSVDDRGYVWLLVRVRDARWRDRIQWGREGAPGLREIVSTTGSELDLYDTTVDVIDPIAGAVIASERMDGYLFMERAGLLYELEDGGESGPRLVVLRASVRRPNVSR